MAQTPAKYVAEGESVPYTPSGAKKAGTVIVQNGFPGIVPVDLEANKLGSLAVCGRWLIPKVTGTINAGAAVFWDADGNPVSGTAGSGGADDTDDSAANAFLGFAVLAAASGDAYVDTLMVKTTALTVNVNESISQVVADPGNAGTIDAATSGHVAIVTAGSETRVLADPQFAGQELLLYVKTDGGTAVVTADTAVNQTGNNTITMADVNDSIRLNAVESGANLVWRVVYTDGAALSTV